MALALGLVFHELATNAVKYGALSVPVGHVEITWKVGDGEHRLLLHWKETGGPPVSFQCSRRRCSPSPTFHVISTWPTGTDNAPYLTALVASSWKTRPRASAIYDVSSTFFPSSVKRDDSIPP